MSLFFVSPFFLEYNTYIDMDGYEHGYGIYEKRRIYIINKILIYIYSWMNNILFIIYDI